jgi:hypothetical protein
MSRLTSAVVWLLVGRTVTDEALAHSRIIDAGEPGDSLYIVPQGKIKLGWWAHNGRQALRVIVRPGVRPSIRPETASGVASICRDGVLASMDDRCDGDSGRTGRVQVCGTGSAVILCTPIGPGRAAKPAGLARPRHALAEAGIELRELRVVTPALVGAQL